MAIRTTHGIGGMLPWQRTLSTLLNYKSLLVKQRQLHQLVLHWVAGINIMGFTKEFNARTADQAGMIIPVVISVYEDRSFTFITKTPPAAVLLKKAAGVQKGSGEPNTKKVATVTKAQVKEIAETKMQDLNAADVEAAMRMIEGTARSMGFVVED